MKLEQHNLRVRVVEASDHERTWLRTFLTFGDSGSWFRSHRGGDGRLHLFNEFAGSFPAGLLATVVKGLADDGETPEVVDAREPPSKPDWTIDLAWLRDYQMEAAHAAIAQERGILRCPTGSGKTEIAIGIVKAVPCRWLFLVHRATLLEQTVERYAQRTGERAGVVGDGAWREEDARFVVATFQTVAAALRGVAAPERKRALALLNSVQGIIVDECHVLPAGSFWRVAQRTPKAFYRIGMSGTPLDRGDRRSILAVAALGPIAYSIPAKRLVDAGVLALPRIRVSKVQHNGNAPTWAKAYRDFVVANGDRNAQVVEAALRSEKPTLVFVKEIAHGRTLQKLLERAKLNCDFVWGSDSTDSRRAAVRQLVRGDIDVLVCSVVFQEGVDIPSLRSVVIATGGKSIIATLQRIGRGMRTTRGKTTFEVWDFYDRGNKWLERHARQRMRAYKREGYDIENVDLSVPQTAQAALPGLQTAAG